MEVVGRLKRDRSGFVFSLDAVLGILVTIIVLAGVAHIAGSSLTYEQQGFARLETYANDAMQTMQNTGSLDYIVADIETGLTENSPHFAMTELRTILPQEVQFKLVVGENLLPPIYPSSFGGKPRDNSFWENQKASSKEVGVATRILVFPNVGDNLDNGYRLEPITLYVWREGGAQ